MSEAPKEIWAYPSNIVGWKAGAACSRPVNGSTHYTRTDAITPAQAAKVLLDGVPNPIFDNLKPVIMGEHQFTLPDRDEDGEEVYRKISVPWDTMKLIIAHALRTIAQEDKQ